ncbi:Hypothetical_protein [Hexamita inflata]|uniref:Hypothetical_protein n=1 Tax=Hexamita inflata TaxID=28002 RepID=A0ABP1HP87_9EUKA
MITIFMRTQQNVISNLFKLKSSQLSQIILYKVIKIWSIQIILMKELSDIYHYFETAQTDIDTFESETQALASVSSFKTGATSFMSTQQRSNRAYIQLLTIRFK